MRGWQWGGSGWQWVAVGAVCAGELRSLISAAWFTCGFAQPLLCRGVVVPFTGSNRVGAVWVWAWVWVWVWVWVWSPGITGNAQGGGIAGLGRHEPDPAQDRAAPKLFCWPDHGGPHRRRRRRRKGCQGRQSSHGQDRACAASLPSPPKRPLCPYTPFWRLCPSAARAHFGNPDAPDPDPYPLLDMFTLSKFPSRPEHSDYPNHPHPHPMMPALRSTPLSRLPVC